MTTPNDNTNPTQDEPTGSLLDNLREPFHAWVAAGSRLGDVVSDFAGRFREDRQQNDPDAGAHALRSPVEEEDSTVGRFKAASQEARAGLSGAKNVDDYRTVTATFAGRAEEILRDVAASARRAADQTKDSSVADEAKDALNRAVTSVRQGFEETVTQVRARRGEDTTDASASNEESLLDDLRGRLDDLIKRASSATGGGGDTPSAPTTSTSGPSNTGDGPVPHMIDGEVISTDDEPTTTKDD